LEALTWYRAGESDVIALRYGAFVDRRVNDLQLEVLRWIAAGSPEGKWPDDDFSYKTSAAALNSRGLVTIQGRGRTWSAAVTEAGTHYLEHGTYLPSASVSVSIVPAVRAHSAAPADPNLGPIASNTLEQAKALIKQLQESGTITVADPQESTRAHYRRVLHACRVHHLVPADLELRSPSANWRRQRATLTSTTVYSSAR
jgi:hypothetical protein